MTEQATETSFSGTYTANLLGNIRSHLAGLQGYDVMALELIQNADDAKAESISFDVTDDGLLVRNSGTFTYCGDLKSIPCRSLTSANYSCDYHRIADVGSGGKLANGENIGRFGIGFVSTYQVTDHPEIRSAGISISLYPEEGRFYVTAFEERDGTSFFLPWAKNPNSAARLALGMSHVTEEHIERLVEDFRTVLRNSLLFLRHVRKAELLRNGKLLASCELERDLNSSLIATFRPSGDIEQWHIIRTDAKQAAEALYAAHPRLESLSRSTKVSVALRVDPERLTDGRLYAFLPTEQPTGLPLHINADFFPEADRKAIIFAGYQHEQAWNEMLIDEAANALAADPEQLLETLGHLPFWEIVDKAYLLSTGQGTHPACFKRFWEKLEGACEDRPVALAGDSSLQIPGSLILPRFLPDDEQVIALKEVGGIVASDHIRSYHNVLGQLGAEVLTLDRLIALMEKAPRLVRNAGEIVDAEARDSLYLPLCRVVEQLIPEISSAALRVHPSVKRLSSISFIVTEDLYAVNIGQSRVTPPGQDPARFAKLLLKMAIPCKQVMPCSKLTGLMSTLNLTLLSNHIRTNCANDAIENIIATGPSELRSLYKLIVDLDRLGESDQATYEALRDLPIWQSRKGLIAARSAMLPGDFIDPTGHAATLDTSLMSVPVKNFLSQKLRVPEQTIENFVLTSVPSLFNDDGPVDPSFYKQLISELANHPTLLDLDDVRSLLSELLIIPTEDEGWAVPNETYRRTDDLVIALGEAKHLWLDVTRLPASRSVRVFIDSLGVNRSPSPAHLADRLLQLAADNDPTEDVRRAGAETFYALCECYSHLRASRSFVEAIDKLKYGDCFPAIGDTETWYSPHEMHAPYRPEAFESQANVLDFRSMARLNRDLLKDLGFEMEPTTQQVLDHLRHCVAAGRPAPYTTYQVLNERTSNDAEQISTLAGEPFIYVEGAGGYVATNRLFWNPQQLGRYAFTIPGSLEGFKPLLTAVGVKSSPDTDDLADILLDIVGRHFEQATTVTGSDRSIYDSCLDGIGSAYGNNDFPDEGLLRLKQAPCVLNLAGRPCHPDEIVLQDSEWHVAFFGSDLESMLCKPTPEHKPLYEALGVKRLSELARVRLEYVEGAAVAQDSFASALQERSDIVLRLLHDKPLAVRSRIRECLSDLTSVGHRCVRIQASIVLNGVELPAPPTPAQAYYDPNSRKLVVTEPAGDRLWPHVINAIFHQLMPEESGSDIAKLNLNIHWLVGMSVDEAHHRLTDAGIPEVVFDNTAETTTDLASPEIEEIGDATICIEGSDVSPLNGPVGREEIGSEVEPTRSRGETSIETHKGTGDGKTKSTAPMPPASPTEDDPRAVLKQLLGTATADNTNSPGRPHRPREKHKQQWDRRLLTYVRQKANSVGDDGAGTGTRDHNLEVEVLARDAVCRYERARGREPEQMAQTHPGYDIISRTAMGEERYIEVKGVNGEWNMTGVGLSRLQFSNAQEMGDHYWLYVVEFAGDPTATRVHPIQSPAMQVTSFMFDGNWRDVASREIPDPSFLFVAGAQIEHQGWGLGRIDNVESKGMTRLLTIDFEKVGSKTVPLNLQTMSVVETSDGDDLS